LRALCDNICTGIEGRKKEIGKQHGCPETFEQFSLHFFGAHMTVKIGGIGGPDSMPMRLSVTGTIGKQTQGQTFGEKVNQGLGQAGGALASGAQLMGGAFGASGIVSAAVNAASGLAHAGGGGVSSGAYAASNVNLAGNSGGLNTVGAGGNQVAFGGGGNSPNLLQGASTNQAGSMNSAIGNQSSDINQMLNTQIAMQKENQIFTSVSNVLKTKHDTAKNSISNIR
jgi:hypothetical protein